MREHARESRRPNSRWAPIITLVMELACARVKCMFAKFIPYPMRSNRDAATLFESILPSLLEVPFCSRSRGTSCDNAGMGEQLIVGVPEGSARITNPESLMRVIALYPVPHTTVRMTCAPRRVARMGRVISVGVWQTRVSAMRLSSHDGAPV